MKSRSELLASYGPAFAGAFGVVRGAGGVPVGRDGGQPCGYFFAWHCMYTVYWFCDSDLTARTTRTPETNTGSGVVFEDSSTRSSSPSTQHACCSPSSTTTSRPPHGSRAGSSGGGECGHGCQTACSYGCRRPAPSARASNASASTRAAAAGSHRGTYPHNRWKTCAAFTLGRVANPPHRHLTSPTNRNKIVPACRQRLRWLFFLCAPSFSSSSSPAIRTWRTQAVRSERPNIPT